MKPARPKARSRLMWAIADKDNKILAITTGERAGDAWQLHHSRYGLRDRVSDKWIRQYRRLGYRVFRGRFVERVKS